MQIRKRESAWISKHYATAIANNDYSGMDEADEIALDAWLEDNKADVYSFTDVDGDSNYDFCRCEVTGLMSDCIEVELVTFE